MLLRLPDPGDTSIKFPEESFTANIDENTPNLISIPNLSIFVQDLDQVCNCLNYNKFTINFTNRLALFHSETLINLLVLHMDFFWKKCM